jgi:hypothetical protein
MDGGSVSGSPSMSGRKAPFLRTVVAAAAAMNAVSAATNNVGEPLLEQ